MTGYPSLTEIEIQWRTASGGVCIIVEGETALQDTWFYEQWFGKDARRFTFFPQDGWEKVIDAVAKLRPTLGDKRVYGVVDRDFEPPTLPGPVTANRILRTRKYTLENYLLAPEGWYGYIRQHTLRTPRPGWNSVAEVQATLANLYRHCLPLSAYNWTLHQARLQDVQAFGELSEADRQYKEHPRALQNLDDVPAHLHGVQTRMGLVGDLGQLYRDRLAALQDMDMPGWEEVISGKYVLKLLREEFPLRLSGDQAWDDVLSAYMFNYPDPPDDLVMLMEAIWRDAQSL